MLRTDIWWPGVICPYLLVWVLLSYLGYAKGLREHEERYKLRDITVQSNRAKMVLLYVLQDSAHIGTVKVSH